VERTVPLVRKFAAQISLCVGDDALSHYHGISWACAPCDQSGYSRVKLLLEAQEDLE